MTTIPRPLAKTWKMLDADAPQVEAIHAQFLALSRHEMGVLVGPGDSGLVAFDLADVGHVLIAGPTGSGRTTILRSLAGQARRLGAAVTVLNPASDRRWDDATGERQQTPADIQTALIDLAERCETLRAMADQWDDTTTVGQHRTLVIDDLPRLGHLDHDARQALERILNCGRQVGVHVIAAGPRRPPSWVADQASVRINLSVGREGWVAIDDDQPVQVDGMVGFARALATLHVGRGVTVAASSGIEVRATRQEPV